MPVMEIVRAAIALRAPALLVVVYPEVAAEHGCAA